MSEILNKNLNFIKKYNENLVSKIRSVSEYTKLFELNTNLVDEYNLLIDGTPVHSITGAEEEAKEIFEKLPHNSANSIHVIYGLGLGYLYDFISQHTDGTVIVYEPDIEALRFVLEIVDFSNEFSKSRTFFVSDEKEYEDAFSKAYRYKTKVSLSALDYYRHKNKEIYKSIENKVYDYNGFYGHNYSFHVNGMFEFLIYTLGGLDKKLTSTFLTDYKDALKNKPALIVSAGPSLNKNIETVKKLKDDFVIFSVGTALKTLLQNDITPDFLNIIERNDTSVHFDFPQTKDIRLICEPYTNQCVFEKEFKNVFITASEETESARWFLEKLNKNIINFETKGTVAYQAIFSAYYLGCNPIVLIGQDLAYTDGECYAKGSAFDDLKCLFDEKTQKYKIVPENYERFKNTYFKANNFSEAQKEESCKKLLENYNNELETVVGQNGEKLPTSGIYALFIRYISDFAKRFGNQRDLFNTSNGGAQINGFTNSTLDAIHKKYSYLPLNKSKLFSVFENKKTTNKEKIIKELKKDKKYLDDFRPLFYQGFIIAFELKKELTEKNCYTETAKELLNKAADLHVEIANNYTNKTKLLYMITLKYNCEIKYLMKEYKNNIDFTKAQEFADLFFNYYNDSIWYFDLVKNKLEENIKLLEEYNESSNTKS